MWRFFLGTANLWEIEGVSVTATAVADDENSDGDSEGSSVEQQAVSSYSVICKDSSIAEIEISPFFFSEKHEPKSDSIVPRLDYLSPGCILGRTFFLGKKSELQTAWTPNLELIYASVFYKILL